MDSYDTLKDSLQIRYRKIYEYVKLIDENNRNIASLESQIDAVGKEIKKYNKSLSKSKRYFGWAMGTYNKVKGKEDEELAQKKDYKGKRKELKQRRKEAQGIVRKMRTYIVTLYKDINDRELAYLTAHDENYMAALSSIAEDKEALDQVNGYLKGINGCMRTMKNLSGRFSFGRKSNALIDDLTLLLGGAAAEQPGIEELAADYAFELAIPDYSLHFSEMLEKVKAETDEDKSVKTLALSEACNLLDDVYGSADSFALFLQKRIDDTQNDLKRQMHEFNEKLKDEIVVELEKE